MKKFSAVILIITILLSLVACGTKTEEPKTDDTSKEVQSTENIDNTEANSEDVADGLANDGAEVLKKEGADFIISLIEIATYWKQDVDTMEYSNTADDDGITLWTRDTTVDDSTVSIQSLKDQTYKGTSEERTKAPEFADYTFNTEKVGDYTLYHAESRVNGDGYKEEYMFVDFDGCTLSFSGCYYNFTTFCEFLEATLGHIQVEKVNR